MLRDALTQLADGQSFTAGTTYSTYSYDCGNVTPKRDIGNGEPLAVVFSVGAAAAGSTDTTTLSVVSSTSPTDLSTAVLDVASRLIPNATLAIGTQHVITIPPGSVTQRYIGARVVLGSGDTVTLDIDLIPLSMVGIRATYADAVTWS